jgi:SAM-dependent methyltransferase
MGMTRLFTWMQEAEFYHNLHAEAVALLPEAQGSQRWMDVGCGPGLVTRLAAARGYQALGIDLNPQMIAAAERIARREKSAAIFQVGSVSDLPDTSAAVVSAASLLAMLPDPMVGLNLLWQRVCHGGALLIIEPTAEMTVEHAHPLIRNGLPTKGKYGLYLWAKARQGRTVDSSLYERLETHKVDYVPLLSGLVGAWILHKG